MAESLPVVLVPGLACTPLLYRDQLPELWRRGPVLIADHRRDESVAAIAERMLAAAPPRFALAGLSMGGYVAFEIMRRAPRRVVKLALLSTSARPDTPEKIERRQAQIALAENGEYAGLPDLLFPFYFHASRQDDAELREIVRRMAEDTGAEAFVRQQKAIMHRPDSRPGLADIHCPTLVLVGDSDRLTPPDQATEIANGITGARLVTVSECGHLSTLDQPQRVIEALVEWLQ
jgi:pimeloyl-ACP methyl ester carboxylesterase